VNVRPLVAAALVAAGAASLTLLPGGTSAVADPGAHDRAASRGTVAEVRKAIAPFRDVTVALQAGYVPVSPCETSPQGGMGIHYMNPALATPGAVDPARPAVLLYAPDGAGGVRLLGAEYWQPAVGQPTPTLAGQPFDGPMPGHTPQMPEHYDLHVWTHVANPAGVFAPWNPAVRC
jgi:hypothetical protein